MLKRLQDIKDSHAKLVRAQAQKKGRLETYYEQLGELGHTSVEAAQKDVTKLRTTLKKLNTRIGTELDKYEEQFGIE